MGKRSKRFKKASELINRDRVYAIDQAVEILRRRVDETGTNEPNILKRGNNRILVELPGLDDPARIKSLLGKTANLTFQFVSSNKNDGFGTEILKFVFF